MKQPVFDTTGKKTTDITLPEAIFASKPNNTLLALAVRVYLLNQRQVTRKTQTRGEVDYTTAKVWRQKGTGRARHGSRRAPIFVGGGQAHGPTGQENFKRKLTRKMRKLALSSALSLKSQAAQLSVIDIQSKYDPKTSTAKALLTKLVKYPDTSKVLVVLDKPDSQLIRSFNNLPGVTTTQALRLNTYEILHHDHLIFTKDAVAQIANLFGLSDSPQTPKTSKTKSSTSTKN